MSEVQKWEQVTAPDRSNMPTGRGVKAMVAGLALTISAFGGACSSAENDAGHDTTQATTVLTPDSQIPQTVQLGPEDGISSEQNKQEMDAMWGTVQNESISSLISLAYLMDAYDIGIENYDDKTLGNKPAIVGADLNMNTADDVEYQGMPEVSIGLNPVSRTIDVSAVHMDEPERAYGFERFNSVFASVQLGADNPILTKQGALTPEDFRIALTEPDAELIAISVQQDWVYNEAKDVTYGRELGIGFMDGAYYSGTHLKPYYDDPVHGLAPIEDPAQLAVSGDALVTMLDHVDKTFATAASRDKIK